MSNCLVVCFIFPLPTEIWSEGKCSEPCKRFIVAIAQGLAKLLHKFQVLQAFLWILRLKKVKAIKSTKYHLQHGSSYSSFKFLFPFSNVRHLWTKQNHVLNIHHSLLQKQNALFICVHIYNAHCRAMIKTCAHKNIDGSKISNIHAPTYVCMYMCMYVYARVYVCMHTWTYLYIYH